jgi:hypothetical protein
MKKQLIFVILAVLIISMATATQAAVRTIYRTVQPATIYTRLNMQTIVKFQTEIESISCNDGYYSIEVHKSANKVTITPIKPGAYTNLVVFCKNNQSYTFRLDEGESNFDDLVMVMDTPNTNIEDLINICNHKQVELDQSVRDTIGVYDTGNCWVDLKQPIARLYLKRMVTSSLLKKSVVWLRLENRQNSRNFVPVMTEVQKKRFWHRKPTVTPKPAPKTKPKATDLAIRLLVNQMAVKNRKIEAVAVENEKEVISSGEFTDIYLVLDGSFLDKSYTLLMNLNGQTVTVKITNIPYDKQEFNIFKTDGTGYQSITIPNYRR